MLFFAGKILENLIIKDDGNGNFVLATQNIYSHYSFQKMKDELSILGF